MSGTVDVVIFAGGVSPVAANPGFNIYNAAGQCTFSTARRPFVYLGTNFVPSTTAQTVPGGGYVPVGRLVCAFPATAVVAFTTITMARLCRTAH